MFCLNLFHRHLKITFLGTFGRDKLIHITAGCRKGSSGNILKSPYPDLSLPEMPLHRYVWENMQKWPNHTAIECAVSGKKYSYKELHLKCGRFGSSVHKLGLKNGENIIIYLPNIPEYPVVLFGAMEAGLMSFTINSSSSEDELLYYMKHSDARWIICHPTNIINVYQAKQTLKKDIKIICTHDLNGNWPNQCEDAIKLEELIDDGVGLNVSSEMEVDVSNTALIAYSSGTTGLPKGVCLTHKSITSNLAQFSSPPINKFMETHGSNQEVIPGVLPFFHVYGSIIILAGGLRHGSRIISLPTFSYHDFLSLLLNNNNINLYLVPPLLFFLISREEVTKKHLNGVREIMLGAAPCGAEDINRIRSKAGHEIRISQAYGLTESSPLLTMSINEGMNDNPSSVGKLLSNTYGKVIDIESKETLASNVPGELCFKGPQIMKCYLNNPEETLDTLDSDGWLHTGDIGYYDDNGNFYVTGRRKELIKVNSAQVAPAELEEYLRKYPGVVEAGVVGVPCNRTGETPVAFVQTIPGANILEEDIKAFIASKLSKHKHLSSVRFIQTIPKTASGKILRNNLKQMVIPEKKSPLSLEESVHFRNFWMCSGNV